MVSETLANLPVGAGDPPVGKLAIQWTTVNGLRMYARVPWPGVQYEGIPIVLVHGLGVASPYLMPLAHELASRYAVYVPDLPGFGKSQKPPHPLDVPELADALAAWMTAAGLTCAVLAGNSLGCQLIAHFAARYPERIVCAVLISPTGDPAQRSLLKVFIAWLRDTPREPPSLGRVTLAGWLAAGLPTFLASLRFMLRDRVEDVLPRMRVPTLVVRGERDTLVTQPWAEEVTRLLPSGRLVVVPGAVHAINFDAPGPLARIIQAFMPAGDDSSKEW